MGKYINPFTDVGFKLLFGQELSKPLLIDFLNNLLRGEREIKNITFLDKEPTTCDMLLISRVTNRYLKPKDYLSLSFGLKIQFF